MSFYFGLQGFVTYHTTSADDLFSTQKALQTVVAGQQAENLLYVITLLDLLCHTHKSQFIVISTMLQPSKDSLRASRQRKSYRRRPRQPICSQGLPLILSTTSSRYSGEAEAVCLLRPLGASLSVEDLDLGKASCRRPHRAWHLAWHHLWSAKG